MTDERPDEPDEEHEAADEAELSELATVERDEDPPEDWPEGALARIRLQP